MQQNSGLHGKSESAGPFRSENSPVAHLLVKFIQVANFAATQSRRSEVRCFEECKVVSRRGNVLENNEISLL
jgi:hypothetical protein